MTRKYFLLSIYIILRTTVICQNSTVSPITLLPKSGNTTEFNNVVVNSTIINYDSVNSTTIAPGNSTTVAGKNSTTYFVVVNSTIINYDSVNSTTIAGRNSTTYFDSVNSTTIVPGNSTTVDLVNSTTISSVAVNSTIMNYATVNSTSFVLPGGTDEPARPGEFSSKLRMGCRFSNKKFNNKYKDKTSKEYLDFTNDIFFTMRLNLMKFFRLIMIIFISIDDDNGGISLNIEFVLASNTSVSSADLSNNVQAAAKTAYPDSFTISNVNITQESVAVTPTTTSTTAATTSRTAVNITQESVAVTPTTTSTTAATTSTTAATTSTTITVTTIPYDLVGVSDEPPRLGEYSSKVKMGCSFKSKQYHSNMKIDSTKEYLDFKYEIFFTMRWNLRRFLRLITLIIISLDSGSVVANMEFVMASNTSIPSGNLSNFVQTAAMAAYGDNITVTSISVTQESTLVQPTTTATPTVPGWGIFLIILACVIVITAVVILTIFGIKYEKSRSRELEPYLNEPPNDKQGILLRRAKMYDSF